MQLIVCMACTLLEPRGSVNTPCLPNDLCTVTNTRCDNGVCRCANGYYLNDELVCSKSIFLRLNVVFEYISIL